MKVVSSSPQDNGQGLVEYALVLFFVAVVVVVIFCWLIPALMK